MGSTLENNYSHQMGINGAIGWVKEFFKRDLIEQYTEAQREADNIKKSLLQKECYRKLTPPQLHEEALYESGNEWAINIYLDLQENQKSPTEAHTIDEYASQLANDRFCPEKLEKAYDLAFKQNKHRMRYTQVRLFLHCVQDIMYTGEIKPETEQGVKEGNIGLRFIPSYLESQMPSITCKEAKPPKRVCVHPGRTDVSDETFKMRQMKHL